jgi:hypothetical protein
VVGDWYVPRLSATSMSWRHVFDRSKANH